MRKLIKWLIIITVIIIVATLIKTYYFDTNEAVEFDSFPENYIKKNVAFADIYFQNKFPLIDFLDNYEHDYLNEKHIMIT